MRQLPQFFLRTGLILASLLGLSLLTSCQPTRQAAVSYQPVSFSALPRWQQDKLAEVWPAFIASCKKQTTQIRWQKACRAALAMQNPSERQIRQYFETYFVPHQVKVGQASQGLFTGYYQPEIPGSRQKTERFNSPLYKRPNDLVMIEDLGVFRPDLKGVRIAGKVVNGSLRPYYTHAQIDAGALAGQEIVWLEDPVDAFFIQVQGSAVIRLDNNESIHLSYAGTNGHPYTSIGSVLIKQYGMSAKDMSMQAIRNFLKARPDLMKTILQQNTSYVFFTESKTSGPFGDKGVKLTPGRSLAVDHRYVGHGTPVWLNVDGLQRLVVAQDKGGAIKGPIRGDLFWGTGEKAGEQAGSMKEKGGYFVLLPI